MICERMLRVALMACAAALAAAGCGNYSNEDLEFMNALPDREQLAANLPARSSAVTDSEEAELARSTHQATQTFNGMVDSVLQLVDAIRSYPPTSRTPGSRTWGPYPAEKHPGWQARMILKRDEVDPRRFDYELAFHVAGGADTDWPVLLTGSFEAARTARRGMGEFRLDTAALRARGWDFIADKMETLDAMTVTYSTETVPVTVGMHLAALPDPLKPDAVTAIDYAYRGTVEGRGHIDYALTGNFIAGPVVDVLTLTSDWIDSGEGRATAQFTAGEATGAAQTECWDRSFRATYNEKPWALNENTGSADACVTILPI